MKLVLCFALIAFIALAPAKVKADRIRVAVQKTGTLAWDDFLTLPERNPLPAGLYAAAHRCWAA